VLSGRTRTRTPIKDQDIGYIAEYLTAIDIDLKEVRASAMRTSTQSMRSGIAAPIVSSAPAGSGQPMVTSPPTAWRRRSVCRSTAIRAALAILHEWVMTTGAEMNEARLRLTRIPKGAESHPQQGARGAWAFGSPM
jgi:hypothetical protein